MQRSACPGTGEFGLGGCRPGAGGEQDDQHDEVSDQAHDGLRSGPERDASPSGSHRRGRPSCLARHRRVPGGPRPPGSTVQFTIFLQSFRVLVAFFSAIACPGWPALILVISVAIAFLPG
ncbi:conserved hypothetical protein [Xanthomonas campestris pv. campestris str. ATCC 33913]|uniref:Uncharacterized protein n=1 Tax=Xanthomonas campestris pv. campestris (strain ATCC 33913 / DSM 3586 / NCPPB 528 / LMG 568 / P 25) TaxID=190485 RepID=Q8PE69_XANCP|nr:conserved hypothetical protein [Xanthomonas campestris pv. campestris str. ATCC 33913]